MFPDISRGLKSQLIQAVICLTETATAAHYSALRLLRFVLDKSMNKKHCEKDFPTVSLKNDSAKQRWELFHRAIAHAKASNDASMHEAESNTDVADRSAPFLSIVR